jgi:hypothetical protein
MERSWPLSRIGLYYCFVGVLDVNGYIQGKCRQRGRTRGARGRKDGVRKKVDTNLMKLRLKQVFLSQEALPHTKRFQGVHTCIDTYHCSVLLWVFQ